MKAREALEQAIAIVPDYANALYFLGLAYDKLGDSANTLRVFERVAQLNPENAEIKAIMTNIRAGRSALSAGETPTPKKK